jgi:hypothetical protein
LYPVPNSKGRRVKEGLEGKRREGGSDLRSITRTVMLSEDPSKIASSQRSLAKYWNSFLWDILREMNKTGGEGKGRGGDLVINVPTSSLDITSQSPSEARMRY